MEFYGLQPGDLIWTRGTGFFGWLIRVFSRSPYAHNAIVTQVFPKYFVTIDATMPHARFFKRKYTDPAKVMRLWRDKTEQQLIVEKALEFNERPYALGEILRITAWGFYQQRKWLLLAAIPAYFLAWWLPIIFVVAVALSYLHKIEWDTPRVICSNLAAQAILAARPDIELPYPPDRIWPGILGEVLEATEWKDFIARG